MSWLFLRMLALVYLFAYWSLSGQIVALAGRDGILPGPLGDTMLVGLCYGGIALALLLLAGVAPIPVLALLWGGYLTLSSVSGEFLGYQWDALLLETGLLAIVLAPAVLFERRGEGPDPPVIAQWLMVWLVIRLMVGSGLVKLASGDPTWRNLTAMTFHYETQPLPTPLAWYAHRAPMVLQQASTAAMFGIELLAPWLVFVPRLRRVGFALLVGLQLLIALTGNYAFFNLLSTALCLFILNPGRMRWSLKELAPAAYALVTLPASLTLFLFTLGIGFVPPFADRLYALIAPLRSVNSYGLFAVMTTERDEIVIEGSADGVAWKEYEFTYKPGALDRRPPWVAPHQPRLDWQMWFAALTTYANAPWYASFCSRLLEGSPSVTGLLAVNPFSDRPPKYVRGVRYRYHFGSHSWWVRERIGEYSPVMTLSASVPK